MVEWFDNTVLDWFLSIQAPVLTPVFRFFTLIGEGGAVWIAIGILMLARKSSRAAGMAVLLSLVFCLITGNAFLKNVVARPRPCWRHPEIEMLIRIPGDYSFPSGHTMSSFAAAAGVFLWDKRWGTAALAGLVIGLLLALTAKWLIDKIMKYSSKKGRKPWRQRKGERAE